MPPHPSHFPFPLSLSACAGVQCDIGSQLSNMPGKPAHTPPPGPSAIHSIEDKFAGFGV